ncbi:MAG: DUF6493 family protein [Janthinobacterium lividum]
MTKVEVFERIIRQHTRAELVPFLLQLAKEDIVPIRQKIKELQRELNLFIETKPDSWGRAITPQQDSMLFLASMRTYSRKEAMSNALSIWSLRAAIQNHPVDFWQVLECARPAWLADWLLLRSEANTWAVVEYSVLRELEQRGFIEFQPRLFALAVPGLLSELGEELNKLETQPSNALVVIAERIIQDKIFLERDLPLAFDFVTSIDGTRAHVQKARPANWRNFLPSRFSWEQWNEQNPVQIVTWQQVLLHLVETGHLERATLLTRCVLALRRDFRRSLLTWFKELFISLKPTTTERLARQADLVELLAHPLPLVVNFAIEQLKNVWLEPGFDLAPLLLYADNLLTRPDLKTGLKTLLSGLTKLPRQNATHAPTVARLLAAALAHTDSAVQERAAKGLAGLLQAKKPLFSIEEQADTLLAINNQAELLAAPARTVLAPWLAMPPATAAPGSCYAPIGQFVPEISADTAISPVADWHELLFLTGELLHYDAPGAQERWLDGLLRLQGQLPAGYAEQLRPYLVQVLPQLKHKPVAQAETILAEAHFSGYWGLWQALLLSWAQGFRAVRVPDVQVQADHDTSDPLVLVERLRLAAAERQLHQRTGLPLLSTPTHAPYWIAPDQLVQKLLRYEAAQQAPDPADLAVALARTAYAAALPATLALLAQLQHQGLRELLSWFFSADDAAPLTLPIRKSVLQQVAARLRTLLPGDVAADETLTEAVPLLWAVAARTKFPERDFAAGAALADPDYPGVLRPWVPAWELETKTTKHVEYWKPGKPETTHRTVQLTFSSQYTSQMPSALLLYSQHAHFRGMGQSHWQLQSATRSLASLLPHNPAVLHWHVVRSATWTDKLETTERDIVLAALDTLLEAGPVFAESTTLLLATSLLHHAPSCRALALEVLLSASGTGRLQPAALGHLLGRLLAAEYAPLARLADLLPQALAVSPATDDALRQVLDALLPELPAAPPRSLRKLLELYADLTARTGQSVPTAVQARLRAWQVAASLKKLSDSLLIYTSV